MVEMRSINIMPAGRQTERTQIYLRRLSLAWK